MTAQQPGERTYPSAITDLVQEIDRLPPAERTRFDRLFHVTEAIGVLVAPEEMHRWIENFFGSVSVVEHQKIVKTTNLVTFEGTLFNALRASRPMEMAPPEALSDIINSSRGDPFCRAEEGTPEDIFGRVRGRYSLTSSNIAKYDAFHGVVIYHDHDPLAFTREHIADYLSVGLRWGYKVLEADPEARYYFFMWNCLWKSGASILHGHAQIACTRGLHYAKIEHLRRAALQYREQYGVNFFDDLFAAHAAVGLALEARGVRLLASLTPIKEKEVWLIGSAVDNTLADALYRVLDCYAHHLGVHSFNVVLYVPPLAPAPEDWSGFPVIARVVDRGPLQNKTSDFGAMELYASSVVASDPFKLMTYLRPAFTS
ncbi:MAG: hypothetical protein IRZ14_04380 [Chloroflexi bacterium]|nr:hypothetical protein [Chloroflexota bacterium]